MSQLSFLRVAIATLCSIQGATALAQTATDGTPDFRAGYEAGYHAALQALRAGTTGTHSAGATVTPAPVANPAVVIAAAPAMPAAKHDAGPRDWWNHSALLYRDLVPQWRHHVELQFSGATLSGNDSGHAMRGGGKLFSRQNRWTNDLVYSIDKREIQQPGGSLNQRNVQMLSDSVRYDLTSGLYASGGFILERDDVNSIDRRSTVLGGLGYYLLDTPRVRINTFAGLGRLHESYLAPVPALIGIDGRSSPLLYLYQTLDWQLADQWVLQQGFRHIRDFDDSGRYGPNPLRPGAYRVESLVKRYRDVASLSLTYLLSPKSSVTLGLESRFDSNPWPDVRRRDASRRLTLNLMY